MLNIGHRGFKGKYPENTKISFLEAIKAGSDGIEFDLHLTKDGEVVIIHDETLDRTSNGSGLVTDFTLNELKKLSMSKDYPDLERQEIMTLEEYFELVQDKKLVSNLELKNSILYYQGLEERVIDIIKEYSMEEKVIISSFNHPSIIKVRKLNKDLACGLLIDSILYKPWDYMKNLGIEYYHPSGYLVDKELVENIKKENIKINVWFGAVEGDYKELMDMGVNGIITNYPNVVREIIDSEI